MVMSRESRKRLRKERNKEERLARSKPFDPGSVRVGQTWELWEGGDVVLVIGGSFEHVVKTNTRKYVETLVSVCNLSTARGKKQLDDVDVGLFGYAKRLS